MGLEIFFGLLVIGLLAGVLSKLNALHKDVNRLREEIARGRAP